MGEDEVWYFAYGSNLNVPQMMCRVGEWTVSKRALLRGYRLVFSVHSRRWGGLAANIQRTDDMNDHVYGAIYRITRQKLEVLRHYEGVSPQDVDVEAEEETIKAKTFTFCPKAPGTPPDAYLNVVLDGLRQHGYCEEVIDKVREIARSPPV